MVSLPTWGRWVDREELRRIFDPAEALGSGPIIDPQISEERNEVGRKAKGGSQGSKAQGLWGNLESPSDPSNMGP